MRLQIRRFVTGMTAASSVVFLLSSCGPSADFSYSPALQGFEVKLLVGSALSEFCQAAANQFNAQQPQLEDGSAFYVSCEALGSGDVVTRVVELAEQLKAGSVSSDALEFPTIISVDGEIYHSLLIARTEALFPGEAYIPAIPDAPLIAHSPMVFMARSDLADGLRQADDPFKVLATAETHREISPNSAPIDIHYVQTAPTRSNSGLQTLVAQFASVSGKRPEQITSADVSRYAADVQAIQQKVARYGISTHSLAEAMVQNGPFWASIGSVYESSVIAANSNLPPGQQRYEAIYPKATFTSNMRAIVPQAPWVSPDEEAAAEQVVAFLQSPAAQQVATSLGLRPGAPGAALGEKFTSDYGVDPQAQYDSYRPPQPEVVEAMLQAWQNIAKKPSQVVLVIDSSGSMTGNKLPAVQNTLLNYINNLNPNDRAVLIDFDSEIRDPVQIDGTPEGRDRGIAFINGLQAEGETRLYDATTAAHGWLQQNFASEAINAVIVLTDGIDSGSTTSLDQVTTAIAETSFDGDSNREARLSFFTVGYGQAGDFNPDVLMQLAQTTGGYYREGNPDSIASVIDELQLEF